MNKVFDLFFLDVCLHTLQKETGLAVKKKEVRDTEDDHVIRGHHVSLP